MFIVLELGNDWVSINFKWLEYINVKITEHEPDEIAKIDKSSINACILEQIAIILSGQDTRFRVWVSRLFGDTNAWSIHLNNEKLKIVFIVFLGRVPFLWDFIGS